MKLFKKPNPHVKERIGPHTRKVLAEKKIAIRKKKDTIARFTKQKIECVLWLETNFDLLQYNIVVRPYIIKIHKLDNIHLLDVLLYIYPVQYFTKKDFQSLPIPYYHKNNFSKMLKKGYIELHIKGNSDAIYTTSKKTRTIVIDYYYHLSGKKKIDTSFKTTNSKKQDRLLKELKKQAKSNPNRFKNFILKKY